MDLYSAFALILIAIVPILALTLIFLGIRRMQGHRTRFDGLLELFARSQGAAVYPPALRGNPDPQVQEDVEVSRGDRATRETPGTRP
jgi:hypothetical protein